MKPVIGILAHPPYTHVENKFNQISCNYTNSVYDAGGLPFIIPQIDDPALIHEYAEQIDGLLIPGGIDVNPMIYNENPESLQGDSSLDRDYYEMRLLKYVCQKQIPILGICRGIQMLNVYFKGSLYQDLSYCKRSVLKHAQQEKRENPSHKIHIEKDSFLYKSLGDEAMVNSFHHQAIKDLAPNFKVSAKSSDGIIEAIEHESFPIYAVQFHPEAMSHKYGEMQAIFNEFLKNCEVK